MTVDGEAVGDEGVAIMLLPPMGMPGEALFIPGGTTAPPVGLLLLPLPPLMEPLLPMAPGPEPMAPEPEYAPVGAAPPVHSDEVMVGTDLVMVQGQLVTVKVWPWVTG